MRQRRHAVPRRDRAATARADDVRHRIGDGWHPGVAGPFILYEFAESPPIVHIEPYRSSSFVYNEHDVADYVRAAEMICEKVAMSPEESSRLIADVIKELETT